MTIQVVGALLRRNGKILLGLRSADKAVCPLCWDAIGGHVEPGETLLAALIRELREELDVEASEPRALARFDYDEAEPVAYTLYLVEAWIGEPRLANDEHTDLAWFAPGEAAALPNLASANYVPILHALEGA